MKQLAKMSVSTRDTGALRESGALTLVSLVLAVVFSTNAAWGKGKPPPPAPAPSPDIVYMVLGSRSVNPNTEIRGETPSDDGLSSTDSSLVRAALNRDHTSIAWAPDGNRFAWLQNGTIMVASPGKTPSVLYSTTVGDTKPRANGDGDALAWGWDCRGGSALAFKSYQPHGVFLIWIDGAGVVHDPEPRVVIDNGDLQGMAFSPSGRHLAVAGGGGGSPLAGPGINLVPMCGTDHTPYLLIGRDILVGESGLMDVPSIDWSRHGERLAVSMTTSDDRNYPWRDLKIIDLSYNLDETGESASFARIWKVDLDFLFGSASSEHSPQWGPSNASDVCQRIAFSQSAGVTDGSDSNGRHMYLLDIAAGGLGGCDIDEPLLVNSKNPRALDWK